MIFINCNPFHVVACGYGNIATFSSRQKFCRSKTTQIIQTQTRKSMSLKLYDMIIKQQYLLSKMLLPWPGFEPGLLRPQRNVLTTIRSRRYMLNGCLLCIFRLLNPAIAIEICFSFDAYSDGIILLIIWRQCLIRFLSFCYSRNYHWLYAQGVIVLTYATKNCPSFTFNHYGGFTFERHVSKEKDLI